MPTTKFNRLNFSEYSFSYRFIFILTYSYNLTFTYIPVKDHMNQNILLKNFLSTYLHKNTHISTNNHILTPTFSPKNVCEHPLWILMLIPTYTPIHSYTLIHTCIL